MKIFVHFFITCLLLTKAASPRRGVMGIGRRSNHRSSHGSHHSNLNSHFYASNSEICVYEEKCLCNKYLCEKDSGCIDGEVNRCIASRSEFGSKCMSERGCMCDVRPYKFMMVCPVNSWCQKFNGKAMCGPLIIKTGETCGEDTCGCAKTVPNSDYFDNSCQRGMLCHEVNGAPACTVKIIDVGVACVEESCICEFKNAAGELQQALLKKDQRCELIQEKVKVVESIVGVTKTCQTEHCACIDQDQKLAAHCHQDQVCSKLGDQDQLVCVTQTIRESQACENKHGDECVCQASQEAVGPSAKKWLIVAHGSTCIIFKKELAEISGVMTPNTNCQYPSGRCLCKSARNSADEVLCNSGEICADFSAGLKCVPDQKNLLKTATEDMVCKPSETSGITVCRRDQTCAELAGKPACLKSELHSGDKCSDPNNCLCTFTSWKPAEADTSGANFSPKSHICQAQEICYTQDPEEASFCMAPNARVLKNGEFSRGENFYCSNEEAQPKQTPCQSNHFCVVKNGEPVCVAEAKAMLPYSLCKEGEPCACPHANVDDGKALICEEKQQCLNNGAGPRCIGPAITQDTECTKPEGCYCYSVSELRNTGDVESIHCQTGEYCSHDYDGPVCLTPKSKDDKDSRQEAKENKGIACALRKNVNSPVSIVHCPMFFTCAWADEDVAICEAPEFKIVAIHNQICTNFRVGCVCQVGGSTKHCQAGHACLKEKGEASCSGFYYQYYEVLKGCTSYCGTWARRKKDKTQYCQIDGLSVYETKMPEKGVLTFETLVRAVKLYSFKNKYKRYEERARILNANEASSLFV